MYFGFILDLETGYIHPPHDHDKYGDVFVGPSLFFGKSPIQIRGDHFFGIEQYFPGDKLLYRAPYCVVSFQLWCLHLFFFLHEVGFVLTRDAL
jgi:hypothetical protein